LIRSETNDVKQEGMADRKKERYSESEGEGEGK
jgi:hypothetical protein